MDIFRKRPNLIINTLQLKNGQELATFFKTSDFERTVLQLGSVRVSKVEIDSYNVLLGEIFEGMKDHLYHPLDESSLRSIFWDQFIQKLFRNGLEKKPKNFILRSEWRTREQFSHLEDRKVDFVALIKPDEMFHTILQVEVGADCFDYNHPHKDTAKLLGNLAQSCISMALDLASKGKSPTIARCYGLLIGETRVQGVVAHPVIRKVGAYYEIHANITSHPHWIFDMLNKSPKRNCSLPCCAPPPKDFKLSEMERLEEGEIDPNNFPVETYASTRDINLQSDTDQKETTSPTKKSGSLLSEGANWNDVDRLNNFIKIIKGRIDLILAEKQSSEWKKYKFKGSRSFGANFGSSGSNSNKTPKKEAITNAFASKNIRVSDSPLSNKKQRSFCIRKSSRLELEIMIKLSAMPNIFPVLLAYKIEDEKIIYEIESLEPLEEAGYVSSILHQIHPDDSLFASICFAVQTLYGLHVLHESFNIVHSDISPTNIMYSSIHKCWKVIDFDQSLSLEKSVKRSRIAGTMDYISPESETSGIFNFESDIFSLGRVMADFLLPVLMQQILLAGDDDGEDDEETLPIKVKESFYKFSNLVYEMASPNPMQRPSIKILLKQLFGLLQEYVFDEDNPIFLAVKLIIQDTDFKSKISSFPDSNEFKKIKTSDRIE